MSITDIQLSITSTSSIMHTMANYYVAIDDTNYVYIHLHLYHTDTHYHALRINNKLTSTSSIIIIIRHDFVTHTNKWVVNLSKTPLTSAQESLLSKGPSFAIAPNIPPNIDFITAVESVCHKLLDQDLQELRAETNCLLRKARAPRDNITRQEKKTIRELKKDEDRIVLTADKGVAMVVLYKKEYLERQRH